MSSPSFHTPDDGRQRPSPSPAALSSLSASLQRINKDDDHEDTGKSEGGFFSFLTPWKTKRKRVDETAPATAPAEMKVTAHLKTRSSLDGISSSAIKHATLSNHDDSHTPTGTSLNLENRFQESARKKVRLTEPHETSAATEPTRPSVTFAPTSAPAPVFRIGTATATPKLKDIRGRRGTPSASRWKNSTARGGSHSLGGAMAPAAVAARPIATGAARTTVMNRRIIRPRITANFRPMSRYLTGQRSLATTSEEREQKKLALNQSLASQILADTQGKLFSMGLGEGGAFGEEKRGEPRTFAEEEALAVKRSAPRVRMNRVLGKGQTGGGRLLVSATGPDEEPTKRTAEAESNVVPAPRLSTADSMGSGVKRKASDGSNISGVLRTPVIATGAATPASKKAVSFLSPTWAATQHQVDERSDFEPGADSVDETKSVADEPFVCNPMPRTDSIKPLDPVCQGVPKRLIKSIVQKTTTPEWKAKAQSYDYGFGDPDVLTPTPSKKKPRRGTPHIKKSEAVATSIGGTNDNESDKVAPFSFMPGGPSAISTSTFSSPPAYKYKDVESETPKPATETKTPSKSAIKSLQKDSSSSNTVESTSESSAPSGLKTATPSTFSGWGNLFPPPPPGEWKCTSCYVKNPKDADRCVSCDAQKKSGDAGLKTDDAPSKSSAGRHSSASSKEDSKNEAAAGGDTKASIGSSGFSFGTSTPSSSGGAIGSTGFSFGAPSASTSSSTSGAGFKFGSTKESSSAPANSVGFEFGKNSSDVPKSAPSSTGFSLGTTSTFDNKSEEKKEDGKDASAPPVAPVGFSFGTNSTTATSVPNSEKETTAKPGFSFGVGTDAPKDDNKAPSFAFGSTKPALETKNSTDDNKAPSLTFGSSAPAPAQNESSNTSGTMFSFGNTTNAAKNEPFAFGSKTQSAEETKTSAVSGSTFSFGQTSTAAKDESKAASFTFGATAPAATEKKDSTAGFSFGMPPGGTNPPASSNPSEGSKPAFSFGAATPVPAPTANVAFTFGTAQASTAPAAPPSSTPGVSFGECHQLPLHLRMRSHSEEVQRPRISVHRPAPQHLVQRPIFRSARRLLNQLQLDSLLQQHLSLLQPRRFYSRSSAFYSCSSARVVKLYVRCSADNSSNWKFWNATQQ
eukprot:CCRYP_005327-RA/>CCRYP_005327-RA protein AED:0.23 eAED:0.23 QI:107/1/1/1/0/0/2/387/1136